MNMPIQDFEADFLWKLSLKILNSGIILKNFTHVTTAFPVPKKKQSMKVLKRLDNYDLSSWKYPLI